MATRGTIATLAGVDSRFAAAIPGSAWFVPTRGQSGRKDGLQVDPRTGPAACATTSDWRGPARQVVWWTKCSQGVVMPEGGW